MNTDTLRRYALEDVVNLKPLWEADREAAHSSELDNVSASLKNLYELLKKFKS